METLIISLKSCPNCYKELSDLDTGKLNAHVKRCKGTKKTEPSGIFQKLFDYASEKEQSARKMVEDSVSKANVWRTNFYKLKIVFDETKEKLEILEKIREIETINDQKKRKIIDAHLFMLCNPSEENWLKYYNIMLEINWDDVEIIFPCFQSGDTTEGMWKEIRRVLEQFTERIKNPDNYRFYSNHNADRTKYCQYNILMCIGKTTQHKYLF